MRFKLRPKTFKRARVAFLLLALVVTGFEVWILVWFYKADAPEIMKVIAWFSLVGGLALFADIVRQKL
jgi:RsiW-degrading membrane proteinase PrsW (M82 family)